jgi:hypothetical protein
MLYTCKIFIHTPQTRFECVCLNSIDLWAQCGGYVTYVIETLLQVRRQVRNLVQNLILLCPTSAIMSLNLEHNATGLRISRIHLDIVTKVLFF